MRNFKIERLLSDPYSKQCSLVFRGDIINVEVDFRHEERNLFITDIYSKSKSDSTKLMKALTQSDCPFGFDRETDTQISNISSKDMSIDIVRSLYEIDPSGHCSLISGSNVGRTTFEAKSEVFSRKRK